MSVWSPSWPFARPTDPTTRSCVTAFSVEAASVRRFCLPACLCSPIGRWCSRGRAKRVWSVGRRVGGTRVCISSSRRTALRLRGSRSCFAAREPVRQTRPSVSVVNGLFLRVLCGAHAVTMVCDITACRQASLSPCPTPPTQMASPVPYLQDIVRLRHELEAFFGLLALLLCRDGV